MSSNGETCKIQIQLNSIIVIIQKVRFEIRIKIFINPRPFLDNFLLELIIIMIICMSGIILSTFSLINIHGIFLKFLKWLMKWRYNVGPTITKDNNQYFKDKTTFLQ
ncbi:hypothetical protein CR513_61104, partial [Mucuna pruriens]